MSKRLLLGLTDSEIGSGPYDSRPSGWWWGHIYPALETGLITDIELYSNSSGTAQVGIYAAGATPPESQALLEGLQTDQSVTGGQWNELALTNPLSVTQNNDYTLSVSSISATGVAVSKNVTPPEDSYYYWEHYTDLPSTSPSSLYNYYALYGVPRKMLIRALGYPKPTVTSVNGGSDISHGDTDVSVIGTDFVDNIGNPSVYLCPSSTFSLESSVEQTVTSSSDTSLSITVDGTGLSGTVYLFVVTGLDQVSTGVSVNLIGGSTPGNLELPFMMSFNF